MMKREFGEIFPKFNICLIGFPTLINYLARSVNLLVDYARLTRQTRLYGENAK
jgi:hypothetical protein